MIGLTRNGIMKTVIRTGAIQPLDQSNDIPRGILGTYANMPLTRAKKRSLMSIFSESDDYRMSVGFLNRNRGVPW